jgi:thiol-disulfide isomerase/thioredoxin
MSSNVIELNPNNFNDSINKVSNGIILFYAPWCGHCKRLKPEYEKASSTLPSFNFLQLDYDQYGQDINLPKGIKIEGFPTMYLIKNGQIDKEYEGGRSSEQIVNVLNTEINKSSNLKELKPKDFNVKTFLNNKYNGIILFYAPWCGHCKHLKPEYEKAAKMLPSIDFLQVDYDRYGEEINGIKIRGFPTMYIVKNGEITEMYKGGRTSNEIVSVLNKEFPTKESFSNGEIKDLLKKEYYSPFSTKIYELDLEDFNIINNKLVINNKYKLNGLVLFYNNSEQSYRLLSLFNFLQDDFNKYGVPIYIMNGKKLNIRYPTILLFNGCGNFVSEVNILEEEHPRTFLNKVLYKISELK